MKAITIWQPWAQLLAEGKKHEETRSWATNYRGPILIHAAKNPRDFFVDLYPDEEVWPHFVAAGLGKAQILKDLPRGVIIGKAKLTACKLIDEEYSNFVKEFCPAEYAFGDFTPGRYAWVLEEPVLFDKPIPASGKQGLWNWDGELPDD